MPSIEDKRMRRAWSVRGRERRRDNPTTQVLSELQIHSQIAAIAQSHLARRVLQTSMFLVHVVVGTSSLITAFMNAYVFRNNTVVTNILSTIAFYLDPQVVVVSGLLSGMCACLHAYSAVNIVIQATQQPRRPSAVGPCVLDHSSANHAKPSRARRLKNALSDLLDSISVRGSKFESAFLLRKVLTIGIQSVQSYRLSWIAVRPSTSRVAVALLVINCISTPIVQIFERETNVVRLRLVCVLVNAMIDFAVSFVQPLAIIIPQFLMLLNPPATYEILFANPIWFVTTHSELTMVLANNWISCIAQYLPAFTLVRAMNDVNQLIRGRESPIPSTNRLLSATISYKSRFTRTAQVALLFLGLVVFGIHTYSGTPVPATTYVNSCQFLLHPWFAPRVACGVVMVDCKRNGLIGTELEIDAFLHAMDPALVYSITFAHCAHLSMPLSLQNMPRLLIIEFYNTTIAQWDETAGLDASNNPMMVRVVLIESSLAPLGHVFPPGLLHDHLPATLNYLIISDTFLREFPRDFHVKWRNVLGTLQLNNCGLTALPSDFFATQVSYKLSLINNNLASLPDSSYGAPVSMLVILDNNQFDRVPSLMNDTSLLLLSMQGNPLKESNLDGLPASLTTLAIGNTTYCSAQAAAHAPNRTYVTCALLDEVLLTYPKSGWVALRGME